MEEKHNENIYMGQSHEGRYTLQLQDWTERAYKKRNIDYVVPHDKTTQRPM